MADLAIKQGEGLNLVMNFTNDDGTIPDLSAATLVLTLRDALAALVATITLVPYSTGGAHPGVWQALVLDTSNWPIGRLLGDVLVSAGGTAIFSDTVLLQVNQPIGRAG